MRAVHGHLRARRVLPHTHGTPHLRAAPVRDCRDDRTGVDTRKDEATLTAAYDDAIGVTAAFNRNVLRNVNRLIGSDFAPALFAHRALYDAAAGRMEMHLEATEAARVQVGDRTRLFAA